MLEIVGDNTCKTSLFPKGKVVYCRGTPPTYWVEFQFVDENGKPVTGLNVFGTSDATRSGYTPESKMKGVTDSNGVVRFSEITCCDIQLFAEAQPLADEMEQRPLAISRNPKSQPTNKSPFHKKVHEPAWRSNQQISAEQHGYHYHYVTIGMLCDKAPGIVGWKDQKNLPLFHFPPEKSFKGLAIDGLKQMNCRHVIEICPFRAWTLALSHSTIYSVVNGLNLGIMADLAYTGRPEVEKYFNQKCLDLSTTPAHAEFPSYCHAVSVDVPFSERYQPPVFMDTKSSESDAGGVGRVARGLDSTQLFSVECSAHIIVAWRGTQEVADWLTDGLFGPEKCPPELAPSGNIHGGFFEAYKLAKVKFKDAFASIRENLAKTEGKQLFICGHSLGGALALTYAAEMKNINPLLHTYGMPRTFTADAVKSLNNLIHFRHVNDSDTITSVPPDANVDNWLYSRFSYLGETLGFFWAALAQLPGQAIGLDMGNHFWHHGEPILFFRATQTVVSQTCEVLMNPNSCRSFRYKLPVQVRLFLVPSLSASDNEAARQAHETLVKEITPESMKRLFPPNTNPSLDHMTSVLQYSMSRKYLPFLSNQVLESAWPELDMDRKKTREAFKEQMAHADIPQAELTRNRIFLELQDRVAATLAITKSLPTGENALVRFKSASEEDIELTY